MKNQKQIKNDLKVCEAFSIIENLAMTIRGRIASTDKELDLQLKKTGESILPLLKVLKREYEISLEIEKGNK